MLKGLYQSAAGMIARQSAQDVIANNLANASTTGFKRDGLIFQDTLQREMFANGGLRASVGKLGTGAQPVEEYTVRDIGAINHTNNPFDVEIHHYRIRPDRSCLSAGPASRTSNR